MKRMMMGIAVLAGVALVGSASASAQVLVRGELPCDESLAKGDLGITGLDCRGECTLTMNEKGEEQAWSFTVEPRINGVTPGGPADGALRAGDVLVAIDGVLITTREGGRRYANVKPGQEVALRFRRDGRMGNVTLIAGATCPPPPPKPLAPAHLLPPTEPMPADTVPPPPPRAVTVGRLVPPPTPDTASDRRRAVSVGVAPRVRVARDVDTGARTRVGAAWERENLEARAGLRARSSLGLLAGSAPTGKLGIGFRCEVCGTRENEDTGTEVWFFSGPIEVTAVNSGGPGDEAGIQIGDLITAIDGHVTETPGGGEAFTGIEPGEAVRLTLVKRNGREETVTVMPVESELLIGDRRGVASAGVRVPRESAGTTSPGRTARRALPDRGAVPAPPAATVDPPTGMPLRYSGTLNGVEVEVRGEPANVMELKGARVILINTEGIWIKIRIPPGEGEIEVTPLIR